MVAHMTAYEVPITVPSNCRMFVFMNLKWLLVIIIFIADMTALTGKLGGA